MKIRSFIVGDIIIFLLLLFTFIFENNPALASDQQLVHGAGTLPNRTTAFTLGLGLEIPIPILYSLQYDIGLGNNIQLGLSVTLFVSGGIEIHSMFNIFKTANDSDFLSLYLDPSIINRWSPSGRGVDIYFLTNSGIAYEHRFGSNRRIGIYTKFGIIKAFGEKSDDSIWIDCRFGLQALLGPRFSFAVEPEFYFQEFDFSPIYMGGKLAFTWAS